jgi:hypothetical protein
VTRPTTQRHRSGSHASPLPATSTHRIPLSRYPSSSTPSTTVAVVPVRSTPPPSLRVPSLGRHASGRARILPAPTTPGTPANASSLTTALPRDKVLVEIAPGVKLHLRGAAETRAAMANGFYVQCECFLCSTDRNVLYCILDCDYFLCPDCRSVYPNPIRTNSMLGTPSSTELPGGLGLGFRRSDIISSGERVTL